MLDDDEDGQGAQSVERRQVRRQGPSHGANVAGVDDAVQVHAEIAAHPRRQAVDAEDADHPCRVPQRAQLSHQRVGHHLYRAAARQPGDQRLVGGSVCGHERLDRQHPVRQRLADDVLALGQEHARGDAVALGLELAGSLQPRVRARRDRFHGAWPFLGSTWPRPARSLPRRRAP